MYCNSNWRHFINDIVESILAKDIERTPRRNCQNKNCILFVVYRMTRGLEGSQEHIINLNSVNNSNKIASDF